MNEDFRSREVLNKSTFIYTEPEKNREENYVTECSYCSHLLLLLLLLPWALTATAFGMLPAGIHNSKGRLADNHFRSHTGSVGIALRRRQDDADRGLLKAPRSEDTSGTTGGNKLHCTETVCGRHSWPHTRQVAFSSPEQGEISKTAQ